MRNLKKILALVLALVMSLSLMATAGAAETTAAETGSKYQTAIDVLKGIEVVKGDEKGDRPADPITRAEVAALLYRIATADVKDTEASIHTGLPFTDVNANDWYTGYISYCYIAEIIKGNPNGTFEPDANINGYATLAMILRAMGYGKNGEFVGDGWEIRTASTAKQIGILDGISDTQLSGPATRELVFEILFRALLKETVTFNALTPYNYVGTGETLGMKQFGLEKITGVVMANEWASLTDDAVIAAGTTEMLVDGKTITVDQGTDLDAVGLTYNAYVAGKSSSKQALTLEEGNNTVYFNEGDAVADITKAGATITTNTEYYLNYSQDWDEDCTSEYLIRYRVAIGTETLVGGTGNYKYTPFVTMEDGDWYDYMTKLIGEGVTVERTNGSYDSANAGTAAGATDGAGASPVKQPLAYIRTIRPGDPITKTDRAIMKEIFYSADRNGDNTDTDIVGYIDGEVYIGTSSRVDISDEISWNKFVEDYLDDTKTSRRYADCEQGNSLRIIDNNGDGNAEYVLKIAYTQDQVVGTYKDAPLLNSERLAKYSEANLYNPDDIAQGDVVNYYVIDGKLSIWRADIVTDSITTKNFKDVTVTTTESGETYDQSGIKNETKMDQDIMQMANRTQYNMYLDEFGNIRSYALAQGSKYALLTEMYPTGTQNHNYVRGFKAIAEMKIGEDAEAEHPVANSDGSVFFSPYIWTFGYNGYYGYGGNVYSAANYLQPAIAHLGTSYVQVATNGVALNTIAADARNHYLGATDNTVIAYDTSWGRALTSPVAVNYSQDGTPDNRLGVFDYGTATYKDLPTAGAGTTTVPSSFSFTNVAAYTLNDDDSVNLSTASRLALSPVNGQQIYRVGSASATASGKQADGSTDVLPLYTHGTRDELVELYIKNSVGTVSKTAAEAFIDGQITSIKATAPIGSNLVDGTGIYPVFANDYVQLDLVDGAVTGTTVVKAGMRHYNINSKYGEYYNTNSNSYVDATVDTEFYIVMPDSIIYKVGYADLPTIKSEEIRAAYAVAHNTSAQNNGQDYWVADVIVIETTKLDNDFHSIALAYYNPYEVNGSTRYVDSLNNQWAALQPGLNAMMQIVPKDITGSNAPTGWGNHTWMEAGDFGFYKLYDAEMEAAASDDESAGTLNAGEMVKIVKGEYNKYGIYAGTVTRIQDLQKSQYMDVDTTNTGSGEDNLIRVYYGEYNVPFYRVYTNSKGATVAELLELNAVESASDVKKDDKIIWVYNKAQNQLAFAIDVTSIKDRAVPDWLYNSDIAENSLWEYIWDEQDVDTETVSFDITTGAGQTAQFILNGRIVETVPANNTKTVTLTIPEASSANPTFNFQVKVTGGLTLAALGVNGARWKMIGSSLSADTYTVHMGLISIYNAASVGARVGEITTTAKFYTLDEVKALVDEAVRLAALDLTDPDNKAAAEAALETLEDVKAAMLQPTAEKQLPTNTGLDAAGTAALTTKMNDTVTGVATQTNPETPGSLANEVGEIADAAALETAIADAKAAVVAAIGQLTSGDITTAKGNLDTAIEGCQNMGQLEAYYKNGALVAGNELVTALNTAIAAAQLAADITAAKAAVDTMIDGLSSEGITTAQGELNDAIDACDTAAKLEAIYKDGALVATNEKVIALQTAVDAKKLEVGIAAAKAKVNDLALGFTSELSTEIGALNDALAGCSTLTALSTYWNGTALVANQTLVKAITDGAATKLAAAKTAANEALDSAAETATTGMDETDDAETIAAVNAALADAKAAVEAAGTKSEVETAQSEGETAITDAATPA